MEFAYSKTVVCFFCKDKFNFVSSQEEVHRSGRLVAFKMFLRYLGLDHLKDFSSDVNSCEKCSSRLNGFWELYQKFENVRLRLDEYVQCFLERVKTIGQKSNENGPSEQAETRELREAVIKKCSLKVNMIPLIKLKKAAIPLTALEDNIGVNIPPTLTLIPHDIKIELNDVYNEQNDYEESPPSPESHHNPHDVKMEIDDTHDFQGVHNFKADDHNDQNETRIQKEIRIIESKKTTEDEDEESCSRRMFKCTTCKKKFCTYKSFLIHKKAHQNFKKRKQIRKCIIKCKFCKMDVLKYQYEEHNVTKHLIEFYSSKIPSGVKEPELLEATKILARKKETNSSKEVGCPFCTRLFRRYDRLRCHLKIKHFDKVLLVISNPEDSSLQISHADHNKVKVGTVKKKNSGVQSTNECSLCGVSFAKLITLKTHSISKHTLAYLKDKLPPRTTQDEMDDSINSFLKDGESHPGEKWSCPVCSKELMEKYKLKCHLLMSHLDKIILKLSHPSKSSQTRSKVKKTLLAKPVYACQTCEKVFDENEKLKIHKKTHNPVKKPTNNTVMCDLCSLVLAGPGTLLIHKVGKHLMEFYSSEIPPGATESELQRATKLILDKKKKYSSNKLGCPFCSRLFGDQCGLKYHIQFRHFDKVLLALKNPEDPCLQKVYTTHERVRPDVEPNSSNQPFQCKFCEQQLADKNNLKMHLISKHTLVYLKDKFPPEKSQDELDASINSFLIEGEPTKAGEKWSCPLCPKGLKRKRLLRTHLLISHLDKISQRLEKPLDLQPTINKRNNWSLKCWTCGEFCDSRKNLGAHRKFKHPGLLGCNFCETKFTAGNALRKHVMVTHSYNFFQDKLSPGMKENELERAIDEVVSERIFQQNGKIRVRCIKCSMSFSRVYYARAHVLSKHFCEVLAALVSK